MKPYLLSLGVGLLVGVIYSLLTVRSPAPPTIALLGLLGMLIGEQVIPLAKQLARRDIGMPISLEPRADQRKASQAKRVPQPDKVE